MAELFALDAPGKIYWDRKSYATFEDHVAALTGSRVLYVGNLSFYTTEAQITELFSKVGEVVRVIMGLDRNKHTPCGFCFVEYRRSGDALAAINFISGTCLDERVIRAEMDPGFKEGRQYGRGISGGQVRDERRKSFDPAREAKVASEQALFVSASSTRHTIIKPGADSAQPDVDEYGRIVQTSFQTRELQPETSNAMEIEYEQQTTAEHSVNVEDDMSNFELHNVEGKRDRIEDSDALPDSQPDEDASQKRHKLDMDVSVDAY